MPLVLIAGIILIAWGALVLFNDRFGKRFESASKDWGFSDSNRPDIFNRRFSGFGLIGAGVVLLFFALKGF